MALKAWMAAALALVGVGASAQQARMQPPLSPPVAAAPATPPVSGPVHALTEPDVSAWLDGYMPYALHSGDMVGAVVMVVQGGRIVAAKGYGYADPATRRPVDPARTLFRPGSVSKLVTWTAVMQQVEAGRIDLDADINTYLDFRIPPRADGPVTMRHLMTHTGGFEEAVKDLITDDPANNMPVEAYLKRWVPRRIFKAGTTPAYSNWGTTLAGYIVQRVAKMPFDDYVEQRVFAPIGMSTASFRQPLPAKLRPLMATGVPLASGKPIPFEIVVPAPAGSLSASGLDMAKFMAAHLMNGRGLMRPETAAMMHDSPLGRVDPKSLIPPLNRMELGFFETNVNGREVTAHLGDLQAFHAALHLFRREGVGLYVAFNSSGRDGAAQRIRGELFRDFADRYFPDATRDGQVDKATAAQHARMMVGLWQNSRRSESNFVAILNPFGQTEIGLDDEGGLSIPSLTGPGGAARKWVEIAPFVWRDRGGEDRLAAQVVDGRVVRWSFDMVSPFMVFDRVPGSQSAGWLLPALYASLGVILLTALAWPVGWFNRRRYAAQHPLTGTARRADRAARIMAWAEVIAIGLWVGIVVTMFSKLELLSVDTEWLLWLLKAVGAVVFVGTVAIAGWNAWVTWRGGGRRWMGKLWNTLFLLAALVILYTAVTFNLLALSVGY
ncbi:serine hydrolase domain-containing protein [Sphingomonas sp. Y38-1Y]|uniref:serine hydrolase domain-containing protein n=1 Tax=Sphingomonas sp. Y38-1Y TaxID=3078265 RepID=UPI0028EDCED1|nr:serine hydrolase domain-containing protein [Sphingomonas sp. Y38-1Y]